MALNFGGFFSNLFRQSERDNLGIGAKGAEAIWSCTGTNFQALTSVKEVTHGDGKCVAAADGTFIIASVELPDGAAVDSVIVTGNAGAAAETWDLNKIDIDAGTTVVLTSSLNINTEDTSLTNTIIDNSQFAYYLVTSSIDTNDAIWGAIIKYTT